ncbi:MAG: phosphopantetheine-binding protein [Dehalococcoidales bacterium]|nr:phosphopantetheine-binding protein [Dehalococcoidales bacterium]
MELFGEIQSMIGQRLSVDPEKVTRDAHLQFDLGADSLAILNLSADISRKYGIEVLGEDIVELENVGKLVALVESKVGT